jgi:acyl-CoA thioester hydrolase
MNRHSPVTIRDGVHTYDLRVYYEDTDAAGVVYHANYLRFAERARTEAMRDIGAPHAEMADQTGLIFMVRRVELDYLAPARLDESLIVETRARSMRAATVVIDQSIRRAESRERVLVSVRIELACVRIADGRAQKIPARWRAALSGLMDDETPTNEDKG